MGFVGQSVKRLEDPPLLKGAGRFADDASFAGEAHMRVVRAALARGRIEGIEVAEARAHPGVIAVWTAAEVAGIPPIDFRLTRVAGLEPYRQPILAREFVRYVGEPLAVVFAENPYIAEDAAALVEARLAGLPPLLDATAAPGEFAPGLATEPAVIVKGCGDVAPAFARAAHVIELGLAVGRHTGVPLETRGALARWNAEKDGLELYGAAKVPHFNRGAIAHMLGLAEDRIHLFEGHVGGGFGVRGELYPEDVIVCLAALRLGRPVKWVEDRLEHLLAANHSRDQVHRVRAAVDAEGRILAIDNEFWHDQGAYVRTHGATVPDLAAAMLPGPYRVPAYRARGHIRLTNKTPAGTYRAPGRYETTFVRERLLDAVAARVGLDRVEARRRNFIGAAEMPFSRGIETLGTPLDYDSGDYEGLLDKLLATVGYDALCVSLAARRAAGEMAGLGLACFVEKSGLGPFDDVRVELARNGGVEVVTGAASLGQGVETAIAQVCADALGVECRDVRVTHGQTDRIARGMGAFASRVTVMTGSATHLAAGKLKARLVEAGARMLQRGPAELEVREGRLAVAGEERGPSAALGEVAAAILEQEGAPEVAALAAEATYETGHMTYPYGIHLAVVRVDAETGGVALERFVVAYDIGRAVNPMLVEGQIAGGLAQGIGGALLEEFIYDASGQPLASNLADYLLPSALEVPAVEVILSEDAPSTTNPLKVKGAGEAGINAAGAAIAAAIDDAIGMPGAITRLPVTPARLLAILKGRG